jgi:phosphohistidine phosphatase
VKVLVVRHAIALDKAEAQRVGMPDSERPLTREGRERMKAVARGLGKRVPDVSVIFTSPWLRATETAELLRRRYSEIGWVQSEALLPGAEPSALASALSEHGYDGVLAVVGHEPHLSGWVSWCLTGDTRPILELRKGGACLLRFPTDVVAPAQAQLLWLTTPGIARR